jgi:hypothetical protein
MNDNSYKWNKLNQQWFLLILWPISLLYKAASEDFSVFTYSKNLHAIAIFV